MTISVKLVATQQVIRAEVVDVWLNGTTAMTSLSGSFLVAELDLIHPEDGWKIYPN